MFIVTYYENRHFTRAPTRRADSPPPRVSEIVAKPRREIWHDYSSILFTYYVLEVMALLEVTSHL